MFNLFKKKPTFETSNFFQGFIDYHSHILPGVDDGVRTMAQSLKILEEYERLGISELWCTPHIMEDIPNTTEALKARFAELQEAYKGPVKLHLAAEYMMDAVFDERLNNDDLLLLGLKQNKVLVETSYFNPPTHFMQELRTIKAKGLFPVLAHPERYMYMTDEAYYKTLKQQGIRFQLNVGSFSGAYGHTAKEKAEMLLKNEYYDYKGTDLHNIELLELILKTKKPELLQ